MSKSIFSPMFYVCTSTGVQRPFESAAFRKARIGRVESAQGSTSIEQYSAEDGRDSKTAVSGAIERYSQREEERQKRRPAIRASQIMTSPVETLAADESFLQAEQLIETKRFRHVPVVTSKREVIGILSDRDVLRTLAQHQSSLDIRKMKVRDIMSTPVITARPETEIREIAKILFEERIGAMPITDEAGLLIGLLTRTDILRTVFNRTPLELWI